jgi:hypothetical protein
MSRRSPAAVVLAALVLGACTACDVQVGTEGLSLEMATGQARDSWSRSYPLAAGGRIELINVNGQIDAQPAEGAAVELTAERSARATTDEAASALLGQVEMREEVGDGRVRIEVRAPRTFGLSQVSVKWTVRVPRGVIVDLRNVNGRVAVGGLDAEVHARTVNGGVSGRGLTATTVEASTVNGGVDVELVRALPGEGQVTLEAVNGGVSLALPPDSQATLTARVTNGGIRTGDLPFETCGDNTRRRFEGTLNGGGASVRLQTTNGGVRISKSGA